MQSRKITLWLNILLIVLTACESKSGEVQIPVLYNQVGYITDGTKLALVSPDVDEVVILNDKDEVALRIVPDAALFWELSGDAVRKVNFSSLGKPGEYRMVVNSEEYPFSIADKPYTELSKAALKALYFNRSGMAIDSTHGGKWARSAGHPDTVVYIHTSAADEMRPEGTILSSPLGWYDAGDYNKYVVNSGITTYTMFRALEDFSDYYTSLKIGIPDSRDGVPDLLTETLYNFRWLITMQDPNDGGVYHKLTTKKFENMIMPKDAVRDRYVVAKTTSATLDYAALMAHASKVLKSYGEDYDPLAAEALENAIKAWEWAVLNPDVLYEQPKDIETGAYDDKHINDEWFWAASELYLATGEEQYLDSAKRFYNKPGVPGWIDVRALGVYSLLDNRELISDTAWTNLLTQDFIFLADSLVALSQTAPYGVSIHVFEWGSNAQVANEGMVKLFAHKLTNNPKYLDSALSDLDYLLGRNATGYCFVTGFGKNKVMNIHHRPSAADGVQDPVPGFLVGGPNTVILTDCPDAERSLMPAKSFVDRECSYSTNEIAINWNAPLIYLLGGVDAQLCR
ncbi:non-processive endocellulase [Saccharicrinis carchari]|uniref:Endoglucanase n=1 Tax=Saccharicrinis carchari TaxID=1168039 RepID=A0A521DD88_SACCC|nr:glycoside hydrolase family 9 protein [Saccharicrinis carchari]SMO69558.1 non-processive endocellulase [Saccharicrinis carchari]